MSHQSGFRHGGHDYTHRQPPRSRRKGRGRQPLDQRLDRRFHDHGQKARTEEPEGESPAET